MLFTDSFFLLYFLPIVLALFFLAVAVTPSRWREGPRRFTLPNTVLLVSSVVFLGWGTGPFMRWIAGAVAFNYLAALAIGRARRNATPASRPSPLPGALLTLAVTGNGQGPLPLRAAAISCIAANKGIPSASAQVP